MLDRLFLKYCIWNVYNRNYPDGDQCNYLYRVKSFKCYSREYEDTLEQE